MFAHKSNCFLKLSLSSLSCLLEFPNYMSLPTVWILIQRGRTDSLSGSWLWLSPDASAWKRKKTVFIKLFLLLQSTFATLHNSNQYSEKGPIIIKLEAVYQAYEAVFHHHMKHWEDSWKYDCSEVFLMNYEEFHLVMKHCVEIRLLLLLTQNDFRWWN